jgi:hypothetical protein
MTVDEKVAQHPTPYCGQRRKHQGTDQAEPFPEGCPSSNDLEQPR